MGKTKPSTAPEACPGIEETVTVLYGIEEFLDGNLLELQGRLQNYIDQYGPSVRFRYDDGGQDGNCSPHIEVTYMRQETELELARRKTKEAQEAAKRKKERAAKAQKKKQEAAKREAAQFALYVKLKNKYET
jgi:hypothetical protein